MRISIYPVTNSYSYANHFIEQYLQHFYSPNTFHLRLLPITSSIQNILREIYGRIMHQRDRERYSYVASGFRCTSAVKTTLHSNTTQPTTTISEYLLKRSPSISSLSSIVNLLPRQRQRDNENPKMAKTKNKRNSAKDIL